MAGKILGNTYQVVRKLDEGGMGIVLEAQHLRLQRAVAVKLLSPRHVTNPDMVARFREEARIVSRLEHPHIVTLLDFDVTDPDEAYLVFELLRGETLGARLDEDSPLPIREACEIVGQVAAALAAVHRAGVVHRDVKPANVFLTHGPDEPTFVKLLDFGISSDARSRSRQTQPCVLLGTPEYMAPEQVIGPASAVTERADQYALALLAYEMLTGQNPFAHDDLDEVLSRVTTLAPPPASQAAPWVPEEVDAVLARALAKDPAARFEDVMSFARALACAARPDAADGLREVERPVPAEGRYTESQTRVSAAHATPERRAVEHLSKSLAQARQALAEGDLFRATAHAEAALRQGDDSTDLEVKRLLVESESLLARVFMCHFGTSSRQIVANDIETTELPLTPHAAFLLSRIDPTFTVEDALDVNPVTRLETLRCLVQLISNGAVRLG